MAITTKRIKINDYEYVKYPNHITVDDLFDNTDMLTEQTRRLYQDDINKTIELIDLLYQPNCLNECDVYIAVRDAERYFADMFVMAVPRNRQFPFFSIPENNKFHLSYINTANKNNSYNFVSLSDTTSLDINFVKTEWNEKESKKEVTKQ